MKKAAIVALLCCLLQTLPRIAQPQEIGADVKLSRVFYSLNNYVKEVHFDINGKTLRVHTDGSDTDASGIDVNYSTKLEYLKVDIFSLTTFASNGQEVKSTMLFKLFKLNGEKDFTYIYIEKNGNNNAISNISFAQVDPTQTAGNGGILNFEFKLNETSITEYVEGVSKRWWSLEKSSNLWLGGGDGTFASYNVQAVFK